MNPPLVVLDFATRAARRYFPKPTGGFMVDEGGLCEPQDQTDKLALAIEEFRQNGDRQGRRHTATERA